MLSMPILWALVSALAGTTVAGVGLTLDDVLRVPGLGGLRRAPRPGACEAATFRAALPSRAIIENVTSVPEGGTFGEGAANLASPTDPTGLPQLCAVIVRVASSPTSSFRFGMFLPTAPGRWNGRFLAVGNGGFGGGISWLQMAEAGPHHGFATLSTDTGHSSNATGVDWALRSPEARTDWGWRALHESVEMGKTLTRAFYGGAGTGPRRIYSYFSSCSTGGRQGLKEIQTSPASFDGVLVGAPAWWTSHLNTFAAKVGTYNLPSDAPHHVPAGLFAAIRREVVRQCDADDGAVDGIVSAPDECGFNLGAMRCGNPGVPEDACLTNAQIQTVRNVYADWRRSGGSDPARPATTYRGGPQPPAAAAAAAAVLGADDELLHPGLGPGSEDGWGALLNGTEPSPFGVGYIRNFVLDDPAWDWRAFNDSILNLAARADPGGPTADRYDISAFRRRGGKVLLYHGTADGLVPMRGSHLYYERTKLAMGRGRHNRREGDDGISDFFRYFLVPGMAHCGGTPVDAPWAFGAAGQAGALGASHWSVPGFADERHDALLALAAWVERGKPVDSVVATTWNDWRNASSGVRGQRPLCPFPRRAVWDGVGDLHAPGSWRCG